jgi:hypothetical protein
MDFDYPKNHVWYGFFIDCINTCASSKRQEYCEQCKSFAKIKNIPMTSYGCPDYDTYLGEPMKQIKELLAPPTGEGYQLWETTTEGSPVSPVFATLDGLCEWCETNATTFADYKATKEQWKEMLEADFVHARSGNAIFI